MGQVQKAGIDNELFPFDVLDEALVQLGLALFQELLLLGPP